MNINYSRIEEVYGIDIVSDLKEYKEIVKDNYNYMKSLGFEDIEDYIERLPLLFLNDLSTFKTKIDSLIKNIGNDYIDEIVNDRLKKEINRGVQIIQYQIVTLMTTNGWLLGRYKTA